MEDGEAPKLLITPFIHEGLRACTPRKFFEFRDHEIASGHYVGKMMLLSGQTTDSYMHTTFPAHCAAQLQFQIRLLNSLLMSIAPWPLSDEGCGTNCLLDERKLLGGRLSNIFFHTVCNHLASFNI